LADGAHARTDAHVTGVVAATIGVLIGYVPTRSPGRDHIKIAHRVAGGQGGAPALDGTDEKTSPDRAVTGAVAGVEHVEDARARWSGTGCSPI
jgi:hypothetical protein